MIIAYSKPSESDVDAFWTSLLEPFIQRPVGLDQRSAAGLYAQRYLAAAGLGADDLRSVSEHAWAAAARNAGVDVSELPTDDAFWNDDFATPLRRSDLSRPVDGAVAILISNAEVAASATSRPIWITGMGSAIDQHFLAAREPDTFPACEVAAKSAYRMAGGIGPADIDLAEVSATSTVGELMVLEAVGLAEKHHGIDLYRDPDQSRINPSGGALPADPIMATGLVRLHEAASRLGGRPGVEATDARTALVHGAGGFGMQNHCVITLEVNS
ncbi:thiolase C-terminal domain-containing protein [Cryobacterium glaciale]|uniref:thiolase C-terminal domain-containing protein n=1 Tax=Cryobacterium glaciale TaxID=1259145 RepID=UPI001A7E4933|nr:hypothetical protein [Cryobacterium glaciale]